MASILGQNRQTINRSTIMINGSNTASNGNLNGKIHSDDYIQDVSDPEYLQLAQRIRERIESRLTGRIQEFSVIVNKQAVILIGHCQSYHTKQMAQHVAMGAINYEKLINNINVQIH